MRLIQPLGRIVLSLLVIFLFLEALQFFVGYQSRITGIVTSLNLIAFGPFWWAFWIVHLLIGSAIPLFLLITRPQRCQGDSLGLFPHLDHLFCCPLELSDP